MKMTCIALLLFISIAGCGKSGGIDNGNYQRRMEGYDARAKRYEEQLNIADQHLKKAGDQQARFDKLLDRWEKQADRYDTILHKWEREQKTCEKKSENIK